MLETDVGAVNLKSLGNNIFRNIYYRKLNAVTPVYWTSMTQGCFIKKSAQGTLKIRRNISITSLFIAYWGPYWGLLL
jgi:hypothetical protein